MKTETKELEILIANDLSEWLDENTGEYLTSSKDFVHEIEIGDIIYDFAGEYARDVFGTYLNIKSATAYNSITNEDVELNLDLKAIEKYFC